MNTAPITVLIADDHASVRAGLRLLLETAEGIEVVGEASDGKIAIAQTAALNPDVVLMDARMPGTDGIAATEHIVLQNAADVLMLTTFDLDEVVFGALRAGAAGFLLKSVEPSELIAAIRSVAAGDGVVAPSVTRKLLHAFASTSDEQRAVDTDGRHPAVLNTAVVTDVLTPRELDVLAALGRGFSNQQIADEFSVTLATVKTHVSSVLSKLNLSSRMQAAIHAREAGLA